jgi:hypothetical protein
MENATMTATAVDPVTELRRSEALVMLTGAWERSGLIEGWPITTEAAATLLRVGMEYDVDSGGLEDLIDRRILQRPSVGEEGWDWNADDVLAVGSLLEARKQWKATPSIHDQKKHESQLGIEGARRDGCLAEAVQNAAAGDIPRYDLRHLLSLMTAATDPDLRMRLLSLAKATLEVEHGVIVA